MKEDYIGNEFIFPETTNPDSDFRGIKLNFGNISDIKNIRESKFDKFLNDNDSEIINLFTVDNINEIILNSNNNISKILLKKIKRILSLEEFKFNFKSDKKYKKEFRSINEGINFEIKI